MKKISLLVFLFAICMAKAQDTIYFKNKTKSAALVTEVSKDLIKYKKFENREGPMYSTNSLDVSYILFANGLRENTDSIYKANHINSTPNLTQQASPLSNLTPREAYAKGEQDARRYYTHPGGSNGVMAASIAVGIFGIIPAIIVSSSPPKEINLKYPDFQLWKNADYKAGYLVRAKKIKQGRVWGKCALGVVIGGMISYVLTNS